MLTQASKPVQAWGAPVHEGPFMQAVQVMISLLVALLLLNCSAAKTDAGGGKRLGWQSARTQAGREGTCA